MEDSKSRLRWRDHGDALTRLSKDIFCRQDLSDVTLTCRGGAPFPAHKVILSAASTYFRNFFLEVGGKINQHQVIFMKDITTFEMEYLLQFVYLGEVEVPGPLVERLIAISKDLGIVGLDAVKEEHAIGEQRRMLYATKRKASAQISESLTSKVAKVAEEDPIYDNDTVHDDQQQDLFEEYLDTHRDVEEDVIRQGHDSGLDEVKDDDFDPKLSPGRRPGRRKRHMIWNHFKMSAADPKYAQCLHCEKLISRGSTVSGGSTNSGMNNHFKSMHGDIAKQVLFEEYMETRRQKFEKYGGKKSSPIWNHFRVVATDPKYAQCLHCDKQLSRGSSIPGRTTLAGMSNHLKVLHPDIDIEKPSTPNLTPKCTEVGVLED